MLVLLATTLDAAPVAVKRGDLRVEITARGTIEPGEVRSVTPSPAVYRGRYVLEEAAVPGRRVAAGEIVMRFSDREVREAYEDARLDLSRSRALFEIASARRDAAREATALGLEKRRHDLGPARQRLEGYREHTLKQSEARAKIDEASTRFGLENAREELAQLEKMYAEDELVDETEQIVLRRARWDVERRKALLSLWFEQRRYVVEFEQRPQLESLVREVKRQETSLRRATEEAARAETSLRIEEERARHDLRKKERKVERLGRDLEGMKVLAPADGILFHGSATASPPAEYRPGEQLSATAPVLGVVDPSRLEVALSVPASERLRIRTGQPVSLTPDAKGAEAVEGVIESIAGRPHKGNYRVTVKPRGHLPFELFGASCAGRILVDRAEGVLLLPVAVVEKKDGEAWVRVAGPEGSPLRRVQVTLGLSDDEQVEIRSGLAEGDRVAATEDAE